MARVRIDKPTPNGGEYSIATYMDRNHEETSVEDAEIIVIGEYDKEDNLLFETFGITEKGRKE